MATHHVPKGVSLDTLQEIIAGWATAGAAAEPIYTTAVADETGISDAVGRQTRFLEDIGVLAPEGQRHRLTDDGECLASALAAGNEERAQAQARELLSSWSVTETVRGVVRENPTAEAPLAAMVAALAGQDPDADRVWHGVTTLLELYEWAGLLARDEEGHYRLPEAARERRDIGAETSDSPTVPRDERTDGYPPTVEVELDDGTALRVDAAGDGVDISLEGDVELADLAVRGSDPEQPDRPADIRPDGGVDAPTDDIEVREEDEALTVEIGGEPEITISVGDGNSVEEQSTEEVAMDESADEAPTDEAAGDEPEPPEAATEAESTVEEETEAAKDIEEAGEPPETAADEGTEAAEETATEETAAEEMPVEETGDEVDVEAESEPDTDAAPDEEVAADTDEQAAGDVEEKSPALDEPGSEESEVAGDDQPAAGVAAAGNAAPLIEELSAVVEDALVDTGASDKSAAGGQEHAVSLGVDIDVDPAELERIVRGLRAGIAKQEGE